MVEAITVTIRCFQNECLCHGFLNQQCCHWEGKYTMGREYFEAFGRQRSGSGKGGCVVWNWLLKCTLIYKKFMSMGSAQLYNGPL